MRVHRRFVFRFLLVILRHLLQIRLHYHFIFENVIC